MGDDKNQLKVEHIGSKFEGGQRKDEYRFDPTTMQLQHTLNSVATDHAVRAAYGGAGQEWHERACSAVRTAAGMLADLTARHEARVVRISELEAEVERARRMVATQVAKNAEFCAKAEAEVARLREYAAESEAARLRAHISELVVADRHVASCLRGTLGFIDGVKTVKMAEEVTRAYYHLAAEVEAIHNALRDREPTMDSSTAREVYGLVHKVARLTNRLDRLRDIGEDMRNQDNLATACPVFMVQRRRRIYGLDPDYADTFAWLSEDGDYEAEEAEIPALEAEHDRTGADEHGGFRRIAYVDIWENVQPFFTRHGAARYLVVNGHNLRPETRIYVESGWRNQEWEDIRAALLALAGEVEE